MKEEKVVLYVAGGEYREGKKYVFNLVRPTNGLPYVTIYPSELDLTSHHSHLYKLSDDLKTVILVEKRADGLGCPETAILSEEDYIGVLNRIKEWL
ncbi:MAG: hypothetical protein NTU73_09970 [Ignavibacteriae bacterium]|nr:hypothetical protein [Ignavibacteriota bacterium]